MTRFDRQFSAAAGQYESAAPEDDTRAERRDEIRQELERAWLASPDRLYTAAEEVLGFSDYTDHVSRDLAAAMQGHPDDQDARDLAFMRELRAKVEQVIRDEAMREADTQEEREFQSFNEGRDDRRVA
jgi:hypothetical protein